MDNIEVIVRNFCACILDEKRDSSILTSKDKEFFKNNKGLIHKDYKPPQVNNLYKKVKKMCVEYCTNLLMNVKKPFSFLEDKFIDNYVENVLSYLKNELFLNDDTITEYTTDKFPDLLKACLECIYEYSMEFELTAMYVRFFTPSKQDLEDTSGKLQEAQLNIEALDNKAALLENRSVSLKRNLSREKDSILNTLKSQESKSTTMSITILGIFVAVVTVLFGGLNFMSSTLESIDNPTLKLFMLVGVIAIVLFDSVLSLFYFMSKLTDKPISSVCSHKPTCPRKSSCKKCIKRATCKNPKKDCKWTKTKNFFYRWIKRPICSVAQKSKFAFWVNVVIICALIFIYMLFLLTSNSIVSSEIDFKTTSIALILPLVIIIFLYFVTQKNCEECYSS